MTLTRGANTNPYVRTPIVTNEAPGGLLLDTIDFASYCCHSTGVPVLARQGGVAPTH